MSSSLSNNDNISSNGSYYIIKKMIPPNINEGTINSFNTIIEKHLKSKSINKKTIKMGVIKFKDNENNEHIHCPLVSVNHDNFIIGVCKNFDSVLNNFEGKKKLASHKYQFHYKSYKDTNVKNINVYLKTNESIENTVNKYILKENINKKKISNENHGRI